MDVKTRMSIFAGRRSVLAVTCHTMHMNDAARPEHDIGVLFEVYTAANRVEILLNKALAGTGLKPVGYAILSILASTTATTPSEVAQISSTRPSTLSGHFADLTERGWVHRTKGDDGRVAVLTLTDDGRAIHDQAQRRVADLAMYMQKEMTLSVDSIRHALHELSDGLDRAIGQS